MQTLLSIVDRSSVTRPRGRTKQVISAASRIWINFDRHALLNVFRKARGRFVASKDEIRPQFRTDTVAVLDQTAIFNSALSRSGDYPGVGAAIDQLDNLSLNEVSGWKELAMPWYSDQVLPFDITLCGTNEMGAAAAMKIFGVERLGPALLWTGLPRRGTAAAVKL